jgi:4-hydroxy-L-threonine phosphate dehydrogenase PdxA
VIADVRPQPMNPEARRHIGLVDTLAKIETGPVERMAHRGHRALRRAGMRSPTIGVGGSTFHVGDVQCVAVERRQTA